jgi:hypothetical protein
MVLFKQYHGRFHPIDIISMHTHYPSTKWYVEETSRSHTTFESLSKAFFTFFQLPIRHDNGLELLSDFKQTYATHIVDHIHKWRQRCSLCKAEATKKQCLNWFLKSLVSMLAKDMAATFPQSEEESINKAQQFELIYSQSGYLYTVFPNTPRLVPFGQDKPRISHFTDGLIGTTTQLNIHQYMEEPLIILLPPINNHTLFPPIHP